MQAFTGRSSNAAWTAEGAKDTGQKVNVSEDSYFNTAKGGLNSSQACTCKIPHRDGVRRILIEIIGRFLYSQK